MPLAPQKYDSFLVYFLFSSSSPIHFLNIASPPSSPNSSLSPHVNALSEITTHTYVLSIPAIVCVLAAIFWYPERQTLFYYPHSSALRAVACLYMILHNSLFSFAIVYFPRYTFLCRQHVLSMLIPSLIYVG